ncbi:hypothetical protein AWM68_17430 [Fictibacillus phosphorivorans]|uniref:Uncharacterized protein n=1 Tax=Fictibacillus phosphorivorans TaxID=1221500 RepID=A0A163S1G0_9BACL|nr:hypothetical protein [Fictibacillus phosphorivorans]KZE67954.1 hypothetical protein AWM68_17430 [Fictibacillus phosphorivorans]
MLKLIVDNDQNQNNPFAVTCRNSCDLFDGITGVCSIHQNVNVDSEYEAARCGNFLSREFKELSTNEHIPFKFSLIEEEADYLLDDEEIFHELTGSSVYKKEYTYPNQPDFSAHRDDASWFISPCGTFACWIVNQYNKPQRVPKSMEDAVKGWSKKVYKSPIPLHDHKSSLSIASKMAWVIDEDGYGQYALLVNGRISSISSPKPKNWKK